MQQRNLSSIELSGISFSIHHYLIDTPMELLLERMMPKKTSKHTVLTTSWQMIEEKNQNMEPANNNKQEKQIQSP